MKKVFSSQNIPRISALIVAFKLNIVSNESFSFKKTILKLSFFIFIEKLVFDSEYFIKFG